MTDVAPEWTTTEIDCLLRLLDEARASIADLVKCNAAMAAERDESIRQHRQTLESYRVLVENNEQRARETRAAAIEAAARLCDDEVARATDLQDQQERRTPSQAVDRNVACLGERIVVATELGGRIRGLADTHPAHVV